MTFCYMAAFPSAADLLPSAVADAQAAQGRRRSHSARGRSRRALRQARNMATQLF